MTTAQNTGPTWLPVAGGRLAVSNRPKRKALPGLRTQGCTHLLTLLALHEGASVLRRDAQAAGLIWLWLPMDHGQPPAPAREPEVLGLFQALDGVLKEGGSVLIHCSAGIHRTGMITAGLLYHLGYSGEEVRTALAAMRSVTAEGVGEARLAWAAGFEQR